MAAFFIPCKKTAIQIGISPRPLALRSAGTPLRPSEFPPFFPSEIGPFKGNPVPGEKNRTCPPSVPLHPAWWSRPCSCFSMANASSASLDLAPSVDGADHWQSDTSSPWVSLGWYHPGLQRCLHLHAANLHQVRDSKSPKTASNQHSPGMFNKLHLVRWGLCHHTQAVDIWDEPIS